MWPNPQFPTDLVTFPEKIFLCILGKIPGIFRVNFHCGICFSKAPDQERILHWGDKNKFWTIFFNHFQPFPTIFSTQILKLPTEKQFSKLQEGSSFPTCYASAHCRNFFKYESTCVCFCRRKKKFMGNSVKILENLNILNLMRVSIKEDKNQGKINLCRGWHKTSTWLYFHSVIPVRGSDRKIKWQKVIPNWYFLRKVNR